MARAKGLALTGDKLSAEEAARWGLIWNCVEDVELQPTVEALLQQLAAAPTRALAATKEALQAAAGNTLRAQLDVERDLQQALGRSDDFREGVAAFRAKRPPRFSGR
jgi:2-(1,2-epoxy-1,2-dihydrophenyl)acetyl-CoA isomerase